MALKCLRTETEGSVSLFDKKDYHFHSNLLLYLITRGKEKKESTPGTNSTSSQPCYTPKSSKKPLANKYPLVKAVATLFL